MLIRPAQETDAEAIRRVYAPAVTDGVASFESEVPDAAEVARRMREPVRKPWFAAVGGGELVGYAYAAAHNERAAYRWSVTVSVYLAATHHRRGVGRALYERLFPELRDLGYVTAFAGVALPNPGSVGLHEALGFRPVGVYPATGYKFGRWLDVGWWSLPLTTPPADPPEPRPWTP